MTDAAAPPLPPCGGGRAGAAPEGAEPLFGSGTEWAIVEIFGHRRHAGRIVGDEHFGAKMLRIDVPTVGSDGSVSGWVTHWYAGAAIFSVTLTDEATALGINKPYQPARLYLPSTDDDEDARGDN